MKKFFIISVVSLIFILGGCKAQTAKDTPHQVGQKGQFSASIMSYNFEDSFNKADIVAQVKITEWLGETKDSFEMTTFKAKLEKTYKNDVADRDLKEIKLLQDGNSKYTVENFSLFKNNDKLVLFLKKATGEEVDDTTYWILGGYASVFRVINIEGQDYAVKQVGDWAELGDASFIGGNVSKTLHDNYSIEFPNLETNFPQTCKLESLEALFKTDSKK
jgi:hypothetical protein